MNEIISHKQLMPAITKESIFEESLGFDPLTRREEYETRFPQAISVLRLVGAYPELDGSHAFLINPYTNQPEAESFANVGEHCLAVACCVDVLSNRLVKANVLTKNEATASVERGLTHDVNKPYEIMRRNYMKALGNVAAAYTPSAYETIRPQLEAQGISSELIEYIALAGKETGHGSLSNFLTPTDGIPSLASGNWMEKIIHLADDMTSTSIPEEGEKPKTLFLTPWERMITSDFSQRYGWMWKEGLGYDEKVGKFVAVKDFENPEEGIIHARHYAFWQAFVSRGIAREIQQLLFAGPEYLIKELVNRELGIK
jgi:hypothetical protein